MKGSIKALTPVNFIVFTNVSPLSFIQRIYDLLMVCCSGCVVHFIAHQGPLAGQHSSVLTVKQPNVPWHSVMLGGKCEKQCKKHSKLRGIRLNEAKIFDLITECTVTKSTAAIWRTLSSHPLIQQHLLAANSADNVSGALAAPQYLSQGGWQLLHPWLDFWLISGQLWPTCVTLLKFTVVAAESSKLTFYSKKKMNGLMVLSSVFKVKVFSIFSAWVSFQCINWHVTVHKIEEYIYSTVRCIYTHLVAPYHYWMQNSF